MGASSFIPTHTTGCSNLLVTTHLFQGLSTYLTTHFIIYVRHPQQSNTISPPPLPSSSSPDPSNPASRTSEVQLPSHGPLKSSLLHMDPSNPASFTWTPQIQPPSHGPLKSSLSYTPHMDPSSQPSPLKSDLFLSLLYCSLI